MSYTVLGLGALYQDTILIVPHLPTEDSKLRASSGSTRLGGNLINTFRVLRQSPTLDLQLRFCGATGSLESSNSILHTLDATGITPHLIHRADYAGPSSAYIILSTATGSRTIISAPPVPDPSTQELFQVFPEAPIDWIHVEGRNCLAVAEFLQDARHEDRFQKTTLSVDLERPREGLDVLRGMADVVIVSKEYAGYILGGDAGTAAGSDNNLEEFVGKFLSRIADSLKQRAIGFLTLGEKGCVVFYCVGEHADVEDATSGVWGLRAGWKWIHVPAEPVRSVVETVGAGDTFIAGVIHARLSGSGPAEAAALGNKLAARKCELSGFDQVWPTA